MKKILKKVFRKYAFWFCIEILVIALNVYFLTVPSEILGEIIDLLYNIDENKVKILNTIYILLITSIFVLITRVSWKMINAKLEREIIKIFTDKLFEKMLKTDTATLQNIKNGEIMTCFVKDVKEMRMLFGQVLVTTFRFILNFIIVAFTMSKATNHKLTIIVFIPIVICIISILCLIKVLAKSYNESKNKFTDLSGYVQESTDSIRTTKAYAGEKKQYNEFYKKNTDLLKTNYKILKQESLLHIIVDLGLGIGAGLSILFGGKMVIEGLISTGNFVTFNGYILLLNSPIRWIPWLIKHYQKIQVSYKRLDKMFNLKNETKYIENSDNVETLKGDILIKDLNFAYSKSKQNVLQNINIHIEPKKSLGIIGVIGSGKTTLMNLLLKLYDVPNEKIFIDGQDINNIETNVIRNNICYITQDNFLFSASLKDNINLFRDIYDSNELKESTQKSMIHEEIEEMKFGINTIIGEKGIDLSGGQKQRVVIARAFISNCNILIFDDTFSALDNKTESYVLANIREFTRDKTCIIISNRISDIKHCDEIVVLDRGEIVERGIHSELLKNKFKYYDFYKNQAEKSKIDFLQ